MINDKILRKTRRCDPSRAAGLQNSNCAFLRIVIRKITFIEHCKIALKCSFNKLDTRHQNFTK